MPVSEQSLEVRVAVLEYGQAQVLGAVKELTRTVELAAEENRTRGGRVTGWLMGSCLSLTLASILLAINLLVK